MSRTQSTLHMGAAILLAGSLVLTSFQTFADEWDAPNDPWAILSADQSSAPTDTGTSEETTDATQAPAESPTDAATEQSTWDWTQSVDQVQVAMRQQPMADAMRSNEDWEDGYPTEPSQQSQSDVRGGGWTTEDEASMSDDTGIPVPPRPSPKPRGTYPTRTPQERGTWFWDRSLPLRQATIDNILATSAQYNFNAIYYTIEDYPTYLAQNNQTKIAQMRDALSQLSTQARAKGIRVDAVVGERNWGEEPGYTKALAAADFVIDYNRNAPAEARVGALQFDVEPHTMATYEGNKEAILYNFIGMLDAVANRVSASGVDLKFDVVAPHFFDSVQNWTPAISYKGRTQYTYNHILDILQQVAGSKYIIMDYRNFTSGPTGSIALARPEIEQASAANSTTKVIIALETGNFDPVNIISYYGMCRSVLENDLSTLNTTFQSQPSFGGFSIDAFDTYRDQLKSC